MADEMNHNTFVGFTAGEKTLPTVEKTTVAKAAHQRLDQILDWVEAGAGGGDFLLTNLDNGRTYRITFCDFTGQELCPGCGGTGTKGSNFKQIDVAADRN